MREMKNSGIEWVGKIPFTWNISNIGGMYSLRNEKVSDRDYQPLSVTKQGVLPQLENVAKTDAHDDRKLVRIGDFAINSRSDRRGSCGISAYDGSVSLINTVLCPRNKMNPRYYDWLFHTAEFADEFYKQGHGIVDDLWTTRWQDMKRIQVPQPSLKEQESIANFLDSQCAEIDALMADIQAQIETLEQYKRSVITEAVTKGLDPNVEMKDSGVKSFGMVPAHWKVHRIQNICRLRNECNSGNRELLSVYLDRGVIRYSDSTGMQVHKPSDNLEKYQNVYIGDFVLNNQQAWRGSVGVSNYDGIISPAYIVYQLSAECVTGYMSHLLRNTCMVQQYELSSRGVGTIQRNIFEPWLRKSFVVLPPKNEQICIANYLDAVCSEIDACISTKKEQLSTLETYKKSLIYEYVTGKKEVPA